MANGLSNDRLVRVQAHLRSLHDTLSESRDDHVKAELALDYHEILWEFERNGLNIKEFLVPQSAYYGPELRYGGHVNKMEFVVKLGAFLIYLDSLLASLDKTDKKIGFRPNIY